MVDEKVAYVFLIHAEKDDVGVAVYPLSKGEKLKGIFLAGGDNMVEIVAKDDIPFGHKIALRAIKKGEFVIEYGEKIGIATKDIEKGEWVHTHNLHSARWFKKGEAIA